MLRVWTFLVLVIAIPRPACAQGMLLLQPAVGFGTLTRGDPARSTDVLVLEGRVSMPVGPVSLGVGALWGVYEAVPPSRPSQASHRSIFAEARRDFGLSQSPYVVGLAGRVGYDVEDYGDQQGDGIMYGGTASLGRRLSQSVVLAVSGLGSWYSLGGPIGRGRLWSIRLEVQVSL